MYVLSAHNICSIVEYTIYNFIINTVTVCKVYAGDNIAIPQLFNYLTCTIYRVSILVIPPIPIHEHN